ncbi:MAG: MATE family efflux transporter [Pseudomonadales bacterium]|nr:MATE family efflux transporter [Pseudomonadales bacterium]
MSAHVLRLSGFMVMGFLAMTLAQLVEAFYLGMVGGDELAAVAFTFPLVMAFNAMTRGIGIGTGAVLARVMGSGDRDRAARLTSHGLLLTLAFTLFCSTLLMWQGGNLFALLGARGHILELAVAYMVIWVIGFPGFGLSMVGAGLMRSIGDPAFPGYVMTAGSLLQVLVAPPLIFGWWGIPALGIEGAAWAFVIARSGSLLMTLWWFLLKERMLRWQLTGLLQSTRDILHVGIPASATNLIQPLSAAITTRILAGLGASVVAGFGVASRIDAVVTMVVIGISASAAPLVGQNWGAGLYDRVDEALRLGYRYCLIWGVIAATIMWLGGSFFVGLISEDPEILSTALAYLYVVPISIGFFGMLNVANASFNALSKPLPPLLLSLFRLLLVYIPLALLAARYYGAVGVFAATAVVNVLFGVLAWRWNRFVITAMRPHASST